MRHTKEPWIIVPGGRLDPEVIITTQHRLDGIKAEICGMDVEFTGHHGDEQKANTRRIVDCVNACAGISQQYIEELNGETLADRIMVLMTQRDEYSLLAYRRQNILDEVIKQRDELLAAMRRAVVAGAHHSIEAKKDCYNIIDAAIRECVKSMEEV